MPIPNALLHPGLPLVFGAVLVDQLGIPVPALPILVLAGAAAADAGRSPADVAVVALAAALIADLAWYSAGRYFGSRVLGLMCRLSLSPDVCVRQTEDVFLKFGLAILLVAKFIPGVAAVGTAMAGVMRTSRTRFLLYDAAGALLWVSSWLALGMLFAPAVEDVLATVAGFGFKGLAALAALLGLWIAYRGGRRYASVRSLRMARIGVHDLWSMMHSEQPPLILDVRSDFRQSADGRIPGARTWAAHPAQDPYAELRDDADREVVVYCACPNEASAVRVAQQLKAAGFKRIRPLHGGIDAWRAAGYPVELEMAEQPRLA